MVSSCAREGREAGVVLVVLPGVGGVCWDLSGGWGPLCLTRCPPHPPPFPPPPPPHPTPTPPHPAVEFAGIFSCPHPHPPHPYPTPPCSGVCRDLQGAGGRGAPHVPGPPPPQRVRLLPAAWPACPPALAGWLPACLPAYLPACPRQPPPPSLPSNSSDLPVPYFILWRSFCFWLSHGMACVFTPTSHDLPVWHFVLPMSPECLPACRPQV